MRDLQCILRVKLHSLLQKLIHTFSCWRSRWFLMSKQGRGQLHIEYKNLLIESFNLLITHIYFIQKDKSGYAFCIKKCYFSSATVRNQRNIMIIGGSNHEISLS